jgi:hypothetical protein
MVSLSVSSQDDADELADLIGRFFDSLIRARESSVLSEDDYRSFASRQRPLDARIQVQTAWSLYDSSSTPASVFSV